MKRRNFGNFDESDTDYIDKSLETYNKYDLKNNMNNKTSQQVTKALNVLFKKYNIQVKISVEDIKNWIWSATGGAMEASLKYQKKCLNIFPPIENIDEMNNILQVLVDAWNFYPHKELDGKSPNELYREIYGENYGETSLKSKSEKQVMPKVRVGDREMEGDEFQLMIQQMEKAQEPFKKWIEKDALPKYKKYLAQIVKTKKDCEEHYDVADVFFQRVLHVGFVELKDIPSSFFRTEFPSWWPSHVMNSDLKPVAVKKSLRRLFDFIELVYGFNYYS